MMVDDLDQTHTKYGRKGFEVSDIQSGTVYSPFFARVPSNHKLKIHSSHAGNRTV